MYRPFAAHRINKELRRPDVPQLSHDAVEYADKVVRGLHAVLQAQTGPSHHRPTDPVDGWRLTATPLNREREILPGVPAIELLGRRVIYLSAQSSTIHRVITLPHPTMPDMDRAIQIRDTSVPELLAEDPTLYDKLLYGIRTSAEAFKLDYRLPEVPTLPRAV